MPGAQLWLQSSGQRCFLNAFVDLKQMRVRLADADPNDVRSAFCGKHSDTSDGQKECAKANCAESFAQREPRICGSSSASNWRVESGRSIATKRRLAIRLVTDKCSFGK